MYDIENNKFYYEDPNNISPETIMKGRAVLDELVKSNMSEGEFLKKFTESHNSALSNCITVSKHTDINQLSDAINRINNILSDLSFACNLVTGGCSLSHKTEMNDGSSGEALSDEEYEEVTYNIIDVARDNLFGLRQTIVDMCSE